MSAPDLVGEPAPTIETEACDRRRTLQGSYRFKGKSQVDHRDQKTTSRELSFPSLSGPTCAGEVCSFQDAVTDIPSFRDAPDLEVVGISSDPQERLSAFAKKHSITYPLLSDPDKKVQLAYGVKPIMFGLVRGRETFFIHESGRIIDRHVENYAFSAISHREFIEKQLQTTSGSEK